MTAPYSPGPWINVEFDVWDVRGDGEPGIPLFRADRGYNRRWGREIELNETLSNMRLAAAAPELLASVIELLEPLEQASASMIAEGRALNEAGEAIFDRARAAIAKARGEA